MDILKNKPLFIVIVFIVLITSGILLAQSGFVNIRMGEEEAIPDPPEKIVKIYEGKIYSTPEGSQFDDYFVASDGREYGIEAVTSRVSVARAIEGYRDTGKTVEAEGQLFDDVVDYGGRQIKVKAIDEKEDEVVSLANPAAVYCEDQGGTLESFDPSTGSGQGAEEGTGAMCVFDDFECEEWAYFRGECPIE